MSETNAMPPPPPQEGRKVLRYLQDLHAWLKKTQAVPGLGLRTTQLPSGRAFNVLFPDSSAGGRAIPCVTTGAPTDGVYPVNLHANGKNAAGTGTGELELLSVHIGEELPTGTWVLGFEATVIVTGGS
jgi:hypothetical protein